MAEERKKKQNEDRGVGIDGEDVEEVNVVEKLWPDLAATGIIVDTEFDGVKGGTMVSKNSLNYIVQVVVISILHMNVSSHHQTISILLAVENKYICRIWHGQKLALLHPPNMKHL